MGNQTRKLGAVVLALAFACVSAMAATTATVTVGIEPLAGGSVSVGGTNVANGASIDIPTGTDKSLVATANEGFKFVIWKVTAGDDRSTVFGDQTDYSSTFKIMNDYNVVAPAKQVVTIAAVFTAAPTSIVLASPAGTEMPFAPVTGVSASPVGFYVAGDANGLVEIGGPIVITGTTGNKNNGYYNVLSTDYSVSQAVGAIVAVNTVAKTFTVATDMTAYLPKLNQISVYGAGGNDGKYRVVSATFDSVANQTAITVLEGLNSSIVGGNISAGRTLLRVDSMPDTTVTNGNVSQLMGYPSLFNGAKWVKYPGPCALYGGGNIFPAKAVALSGYGFTGWTTDGGATVACSTAKETNVSLTSSGTLTASFAAKPYKTLSVAMNPTSNTAYPIQVADVNAHTFFFTGDVSKDFTWGMPFDVQDGENASPYTVQSSYYPAYSGWITSVDTVRSTFTVHGAKQQFFPASSTIIVGYSNTGNDGRYTVASTTYDQINNETVITVTSKIPSATANGDIYADMTEVYVNESIFSSAPGGSAIIYDAGHAFLTWRGDIHGEELVPVGEWIALNANAETGWRFASWTVTSGDAILSNPLDSFCKVWLQTTDATVTANFVETGTANLTMAITPSDKGVSAISNVFIARQPINSFEIYGSHLEALGAGASFTISGSPANDGTYTVNASYLSHTYWSIQAVNPAAKTFTGNFDIWANYFIPGAQFAVSESEYNNGHYTVVSSTYDTVTRATVVTVMESIPSAVADGYINMTSTQVDVQSQVPSPLPGGIASGSVIGCASFQSMGMYFTSGVVSLRDWRPINATERADAPYEFDHWQVTGNAIVEDIHAPSTRAMILGDATLTAVYKDSATLGVDIAAASKTLVGQIADVTNNGASFIIPMDKTAAFPPNTTFMIDESTNEGVFTTVSSPAVYQQNYIEDVSGVNQAAKTFSVLGNQTGKLLNGVSISIINSTGNNGKYTAAAAATYDITTNTTTVTVAEAIPSATADGDIYYGGTVVTITRPFAYLYHVSGLVYNVQGYPGYGDTRFGQFLMEVTKGDNIELTAYNQPGYKFQSWSATANATILNPNAQTTYVTLTGDATVTAAFAPDTFSACAITVATDPVDGGHTTVNSWLNVGLNTEEVGFWHKVEVVPSAGYIFQKWVSSDSTALAILDPLDPSTSILPNAVATLTAVFQVDPNPTVCLEIAASPVQGGTETHLGLGKHVLAKGVDYHVEAMEHSGYRFIQWLEEGDGEVQDYLAASTTIRCVGNAKLTAVFQARPGTLIPDADVTFVVQPCFEAGMLNYTPSTYSFDTGIWYKLSAHPAIGWEFDAWTVQGGATVAGLESPETYFSLSAPGVIVANFVRKTAVASLTLANSPELLGKLHVNDEVVIEKVQILRLNEWHKIVATPVDEALFTGWTVTGGINLVEPNHAENYFWLTGDATITANYVSKSSPDISTLTVAVSPSLLAGNASMANGGVVIDVNKGITSTLICQNEIFEIQASTAPGYKFVGWLQTGEILLASPASASTEFYVLGDATLTALFEAVNMSAVTLVVTPDDCGSITMGETSFIENPSYVSVPTGTWVSIAAFPVNEAYRFVKWTLSGSASFLAPSEDATRSETMVCIAGDATVTAEFAAVELTELDLSLSPGNAAHALGDVNVGLNMVPKGVPIYIGVETHPGYQFSSWSIHPVENFKMIDSTAFEPEICVVLSGPVIAIAEFKETGSAKLTISGAELGEVKPYGYGTFTVPTNQWLPVQALPPPAYVFDHWTLSGNATMLDVNNQVSYVFVTGDAAITANFFTWGTVNGILQISASPVCGGDVRNVDGESILGLNSLTTYTWHEISPVPTLDYPSGYKFSGWASTGMVKVKKAESTDYNGFPTTRHYVWIEGDGTLTANFTPVTTGQLTVSVTPANSATVQVCDLMPDDNVLSINDWHYAQCQPFLGYRFVKWTASGNVIVTDSTKIATTIYLSGDATLTAELESVGTVGVTTACNPVNGGILMAQDITYKLTPNGMNLVTKGASYLVMAAPAHGFVFSGWTVSGGVKHFAGDEMDNGGFDFYYGYFVADAEGTLTANFTATSVAAVSFNETPVESGVIFPNRDIYDMGGRSMFWTVGRPYAISTWAFEGYRFVKWSATSGDVVFDNPTHEYTKATVRSGTSAAIVANFEAIPTAQLTMMSSPAQAMPYMPVALVYDECMSYVYYDYWQMGTRTVNANNTYLITVYPEAPYYFTGWNVQGQANIVRAPRLPCESSGWSMYDRYFITVMGDATVTAQFAEKGTATLSLGTSPADAGRTMFYSLPSYYGQPSWFSTAETVFKQTAYKIEAMPAPGWYFSHWETQGPVNLYFEIGSSSDQPVGDMSVSSSYSDHWVYATLTGDATVTAVYSQTRTQLFLTLASNNPAAGSVYPRTGVYEVPYNVPVKIMANPKMDGLVYTFAKWTTDKDSAAFLNASEPQTLVSIIENTVVTANFNMVTEASLSMVSDPVGAGFAAPVEFGTSGLFRTGEWFTVLAMPKDGFAFEKWTGAGGVNIKNTASASTDVVLTANATMTATFKALPKGKLTMEAYPANGGTTDPAAGVHDVYLGTYVVNAYPAAGWSFLKWEILSGSSYLTYEAGKPVTQAVLHIGSDTTLRASFTSDVILQPVLTIGVNPVGGGNIIQPNGGAGTYKLLYGEPYPIEADPAKGFYFLGWQTDKPAVCAIADVGAASTTVKLTGDATVTAMFSSKLPGALSVRVMTCSLDNSKPNNDYLNLGSAELVGAKVPDPRLENRVTIVSFEGYQATIQAGQWSTDKNTPIYDANGLRVLINLSQATMQINIKGAALASLIDSADGLDFNIYIGDQLFKGTAYPNEKTTWKYSSKVKEGITSIQGSRSYTAGSTKPLDSMKITGYGLVMPAGYSTAAIPTVYVDDMGLVADNAKVTVSKSKYTYKSLSKEPQYTLILDFTTAKPWSLNLTKSFEGWQWSKSGEMTIAVQYDYLGGDQSFTVAGVIVKSTMTVKK